MNDGVPSSQSLIQHESFSNFGNETKSGLEELS